MMPIELSLAEDPNVAPETTSTRICCGEQDVFVVLDSDEMWIVSEWGGNTRGGSPLAPC